MSEIKPWGYVRQDVLMTTSHNFTSGYTVPVYTADALRQARDDALADSQREIERLREELAAAQRDSALFLWLADAEPFSARWQIVRLEWWRGRDGWNEVRGDALRAAIDAAMAQEKRDDQ